MTSNRKLRRLLPNEKGFKPMQISGALHPNLFNTATMLIKMSRRKDWAESWKTEDPAFKVSAVGFGERTSVQIKPATFSAVVEDRCPACPKSMDKAFVKNHVARLEHYVMWCRWHPEESVERFPSSSLPLTEDKILGII